VGPENIIPVERLRPTGGGGALFSIAEFGLSGHMSSRSGEDLGIGSVDPYKKT
jgi:hypothetical protein